MAKKTIKDTFNMVITKAMESAEVITAPEKQAMAYAAIAQALAQTGAIQVGAEIKASDEVNVPAEAPAKAAATENMGSEDKARTTAARNEGKESLKRKPAKTAAPKKEEAAPAKPAPAEEPTFTSEWTDEALDYFANEVEFVQQKNAEYTEAYGEGTMEQMVEAATEGQYKSVEDITPLNIRFIVSYIQQCEAQAEEQEAS